MNNEETSIIETELYDDYIEDAFTKEGNDVNLEVDHITTKCLLSKNEKFSLDENGNLIVNSISFSGSSGEGVFDLIYPIGSIYMSVNQISPSTLFGGIWERLSGGFLYGCVNEAGNSTITGTLTAAATGNTGAATGDTGSTILTISQIPSHQHNIQGHNDSGSTVTWTDKAVTYASNNKGYNAGVRISYQGGGQGHTHTLNSHTHTLNSHTHNIPYMSVYIWKRTS